MAYICKLFPADSSSDDGNDDDDDDDGGGVDDEDEAVVDDDDRVFIDIDAPLVSLVPWLRFTLCQKTGQGPSAESRVPYRLFLRRFKIENSSIY